MEEIYEFLRTCGSFHISALQGDQFRLKPYGAVDIFDGKLYLQTGSTRMKSEGRVELQAVGPKGGWLKIRAKAVPDDRPEAREHMMEKNPVLKNMYPPEQGGCQVLYLEDAEATFSSYAEAPRTVTF